MFFYAKKKKMATRVKCTLFGFVLALLLAVRGVSFAEKSLEIKCDEVNLRIIAQRKFFGERSIPFRPEHLRLGANSTQQRTCGPKRPIAESEMVISAGLQECGTQSSVREEGQNNSLAREKIKR